MIRENVKLDLRRGLKGDSSDVGSSVVSLVSGRPFAEVVKFRKKVGAYGFYDLRLTDSPPISR